jgi:protein TonB
MTGMAAKSVVIPLPAAPMQQRAQRMLPLGLIIAAHIGVFYILQSGMLRQSGPVKQTAPREIFASLIAIDNMPQQAPQKQPAIQPKAQPVHKKEPAPRPVTPTPAPAPHAITREPAVAPTPPAAQPPVQPVARQEQPAASAPTPSAPSATPTTSIASAIPAPPKTTASGFEVIKKQEPEYPQMSKRLGEEGSVLLRVLVNEKGQPESVAIQKSAGLARLDEAARQAVLKWLFKPYSEDGKAVSKFVLVPVNFQLNK